MYNEGNSISHHLNEIQGCFDQLFGMGVKLDDEIYESVFRIPIQTVTTEALKTMSISKKRTRRQ